LEPFTHVSLMVYRGRGALDTVSQAEIIDPFRSLRADLGLFAAGETMLEAVDKVAEEHERNVRLFMLLLTGMRALDAQPTDSAAVAESFLLKLLSLSGFHPSLRACAVCGVQGPDRFASGQGGAVCAADAELDAGYASPEALEHLAELGGTGLLESGEISTDTSVRRESRALLFGFAEYHLERRMKSLPILARSLAP
jgi:DNA repair protein RecO (recombination protein O)